MNMAPMTPYFLVRVSKQEEKKSKSTIGSFILPETIAFMANNTQCGEIVDIGSGAASYFPEAKIGFVLLFHHFVQQASENDAKEEHLVDWDDTYNYYVVTAYDCDGKANETYGVWDGEKIIPNKDYVFLESAKPKVNSLTPDEIINQALQKTDSGLLIFKEWEETREQREEKQAELKRQNEELAKSGTNKLHVMQAITMNQWEAEAIGRDVNHQCYKPYPVAYANPELSKHFSRPIVTGDIIYLLNLAAQTELPFNGTTFIVSKTKFIGCLFKG